MITINDKHDCCGCEACVQRCPKQCISMQPDEEGFPYPVVDTALCIECGMCQAVCPVLAPPVATRRVEVLAAKARDTALRDISSSGGIFSLLAMRTIGNGGVVFGAMFDKKMDVVHGHTETLEGLDALRRSKYVQSRIGSAYADAERFLKAGREVLFTGTPCQIKGLRLFLRKEYSNLIAVDIVCHGVPSPMVWHKFIDEYIKPRQVDEITSFNFRDKRLGWENFSLTAHTINRKNGRAGVKTAPFRDIPYMRAFLKDMTIRPCCEKCCAETDYYAGDLSIGDFWGIKEHYPQFHDTHGVSIVIANTHKGRDVVSQLDMDSIPAQLEHAQPLNNGLRHHEPLHPCRAQYFANLHKAKDFSSYTERHLTPFARRVKNKVKRLIKHLLRWR